MGFETRKLIFRVTMAAVADHVISTVRESLD